MYCNFHTDSFGLDIGCARKSVYPIFGIGLLFQAWLPSFYCIIMRFCWTRDRSWLDSTRLFSSIGLDMREFERHGTKRDVLDICCQAVTGLNWSRSQPPYAHMT